MSIDNFNDLNNHFDHDIKVVRYTIPDTDIVENTAIECLNCDEVLLDYDREGE